MTYLNKLMLLPKEDREPLIHEPTPIHMLGKLAKKYGHPHLLIKREDKTASIYGGNKVRNLEYLFHDAKFKGASKLVTAAPVGSNFVAALAAQAHRVGFGVEVHQFFPQVSQQMRDHDRFSQKFGGQFIQHHSKNYLLGASKAFLESRKSVRQQTDSYWIAPGGSSWLGAMGHFMAMKELLEQRIPDCLVVGLGTGGTMAGLLAGVKHFQLNTQIVGIRCVDRVIANKFKVIYLANQLLKNIGSKARVRLKDIHILATPRELETYGQTSGMATDLIQEVCDLEMLNLDTTYTSKVFYVLKKKLQQGEFRQRSVLYWHTFSRKALAGV